MVWQLPRQQSDNPDRWTDKRPVEMKKLKCQSRNRTRERGRRRVQASSSGNGSAYKNNLASNKIGKIASNWIRALLSIDRRGVPARLKHLLRELWEESGSGSSEGKGWRGQLPANTHSELRTSNVFFFFSISSTLQPFHALTQLEQILWECRNGREGKGRSRAMRVECSILK